ncbi:hypothetical protein ABTZ99_13830 [Actinosynnema sp. NPDC002837]
MRSCSAATSRTTRPVLGYPHDPLAGDHVRAVTAGDLKIEPRR